MLKQLLRRFIDRRLRMTPLIVITGPTAVGKTRLSLKIAENFDCEIVNADSMQIYDGLDITTNKPLIEERSRVPHHLFGFVDPENTSFSVRAYRDLAVNTIDAIMRRKNLPVLVGGSNYYIESVLWKNLIDTEEVDRPRSPSSESSSVSDDTTDYELLKELDPEIALTIHPSDRRRIKRALEIIKGKGKKYSQLLNEQHDKSGSSFRGERRYTNVCVIWLTCALEELFARINERTEEMLKRGMLEEIKNFVMTKELESIDFERGIFQCIGIKEFYAYFHASLKGNREESDLKEILLKCKENLNVATLRYAKYQQKWIRKRFLKVDSSNLANIFKLEGTTQDAWVDEVEKPALNLIRSFIEKDLPLKPLISTFSHKDTYERHTCDFCDGQLFITKKQWLEHLASRRHKKRLKNNAKSNPEMKIN